ncbi:MAG: S-methyl-5-thioribose-1-phosphate isomerase [Oscillospiraceae bacterium]|nr:S-methyl-5-thioribose-1-phosphate isomerase [Oscillospiraceae bacterium]MBR6561486.1 S-methyl-5-thioribose-1-phosphate isomerase [Oscillospiraceae bacterium]
MQTVDHVHLSEDEKELIILDQTQLPNRRIYLRLRSREELFRAIKELQVRGAPAIGIFAGFAMYVLAQQYDREEFLSRFREDAAYLNSSRPTAVNLSWALRRMTRTAEESGGDLRALRAECQAILDEDIAMCTAISEHGLSLLKEGDGVLTHCNAGPIATSRYGTAIGPILLAQERGIRLRAFCDETRPLLQGARLTSWELQNAGVDTTLICDNMAATVMSQGKIQFCFVGCDRVAANGDTANKIGTYGVAILAKHFGIPFYVLGPSSTIDMACATGKDIPVELREADEIRSKWYREPMAPEGVKCYNPSFDVTDHSLISGIITEKGICRPPYTESLKALFE